MNMIKQAHQSPQHQVLDPCLLGRPVHLLHTFTEQLRGDLSALFLDINRRYKASFRIGDVALARMDRSESTGRWIAYRATHGQIAFSPERSVLLSVLDYRYGRRGGAASGGSPAAAAPDRVTATEERLASSLGMQLVKTLAARIDGKDGAASHPQDFSAAPSSAPLKGAWTVSVVVQDMATGIEGGLWFTLDEAWMTRLLRGLAPARARLNKPHADMQPLPARLQLTLTGRLTSKEMLLGDLLAVRVGDVIPITLSRTDVLLDDARLFTAAVAEHQGKLCLTSFEDVE
jgi:flagellar motor switch protein FliM